MPQFVLLLGVVFPVFIAVAFLLGRHARRRPAGGDVLSPVIRQHIDLFQGGRLSPTAVEAAKGRFRVLLESGDIRSVEASMRPGTQFAIHVRALAEIGTDDAGRILERQLGRRLSRDQLEQSWYWMDVAAGLRTLNREESLPRLLRCAEQGDLPLGHFLAAEAVCFLGFPAQLAEPESAPGRTALRVLYRALEGLRNGVPPQVMAEARLGEVIEQLWDRRPERVDPLLVCVFAEVLRQLRRVPHAEQVLAGDAGEGESFRWQVARLAGLEEALADYLDQAPAALRESLVGADAMEERDALIALRALKAEAGSEAMAVLESESPNRPLAVELLGWSSVPEAGAWLRAWALRQVPVFRRARQRRRPMPPARPSLPAEIPYAALLRALRGHPSMASEAFLLMAARDGDPTYRGAAISSLGWWEPLERRQVLECLHEARHDPNPDVRHQARCALARLGERYALGWFRRGLASDDSLRLHEAIQLVAVEGLTLLWPELDLLADCEDPDVALHAREATARMSEALGSNFA